MQKVDFLACPSIEYYFEDTALNSLAFRQSHANNIALRLKNFIQFQNFVLSILFFGNVRYCLNGILKHAFENRLINAVTTFFNIFSTIIA